MSASRSSAVELERDLSVSMRKSVCRYFFYGWLFHDAATGSDFERATALRHNRDQAKSLPVYMMRWVIGGAVLAAFVAVCEHTLSSPVLSATFAVALTLAVLFLLVTGICWLFLQTGR